MTTETDSLQPAALPAALVVEALVGLVFGFVMAVIAGTICALALNWTGLDNQLGMGSLGVTLYAGLLGFAFGAAAGVALAGRWLRQGGSFWLALAGGVLGIILMTVLVRLGLLSDNRLQLVALTITSLGLAVLGYNLRRGLAA
jgi:hypothetical protein